MGLAADSDPTAPTLHQVTSRGGCCSSAGAAAARSACAGRLPTKIALGWGFKSHTNSTVPFLHKFESPPKALPVIADHAD